jgi:small redox-active disulfide protein 2
VVIKVLGPGCPNCEKVADLVWQAAVQMGMTDATIVKVKERAEFQRYGLLYTPGLVINEKLVCGGRIPSLAEVSNWLANAAMEG